MLDPRLDHLEQEVDYIITTMELNEQKFEEMILAINAFIDNIFVERATGQKLMKDRLPNDLKTNLDLTRTHNICA
jgi:hypothetical protein